MLSKETMEDLIYSVRLKLADEKSGIYVLFALLLNSDRTIEGFHVLAAATPAILEIPENATFQDFANRINMFRNNNDYLHKITEKLQKHLNAHLKSDNFLEEAMHYLGKALQDNMSALLKRLLAETAESKSPKLTLSIANISRDQVAQTIIQTEEPEETPAAEEAESPAADTEETITPEAAPVHTSVPEGARVIGYKFILSPVSGVAVTDLKKGDRILVKLNISEPAAMDTAKSLNLFDENGDLQPIPVVVTDNIKSGTTSDVYVKITETIFGKYVEEENSVKVKLATKETIEKIKKTTPNTKKEKETANKAGIGPMLIAIGVILVLIILLFAVVI